jgi:hypothetical protein
MSRIKSSTGNTQRTDREKLELFLRRVEDLAKTNLAQKGIRTNLSYTANTTSGLNMSLIEPEEEELLSFLPMFRQFISEEEPVFLDRIYGICSKRLIDDELKKLVAGSREIWKKTQVVSGIELVINGENISGLEVWKIWINGKYFHNDLRYEQILRQASPVELTLCRFNFINFIGKAGECLRWLDGFIYKALDENKFDFELQEHK